MPLDKHQIHALILTVVRSYANGNRSIELRVPSYVKLDSDFPTGETVHREASLVVIRIHALRVLKWLNEKGYFNITPIQLRNELISQGIRYKEMNL